MRESLGLPNPNGVMKVMGVNGGCCLGFSYHRVLREIPGATLWGASRARTMTPPAGAVRFVWLLLVDQG